MDASASNDGLLDFRQRRFRQFAVSLDGSRQKTDQHHCRQAPGVARWQSSPRKETASPSRLAEGRIDIWVLDLARGVRTRLTFGPIANMNPVWSPDGKWIAYVSFRSGHFDLCRKPSDGSGAEEILFTDDHQILSTDWSRDGKYLLYSRCSVDGHCEIWDLPLEGDRKPSLVLPSGTNASLSPDSRWLAYQSLGIRPHEVYVVPFSGGQGKWQVSANGGTQPRWSKDGKELYYTDLTFNILRGAGEGMPAAPCNSARLRNWPSVGLPHRSSTTSRPTARKSFSTGLLSR